MQTGSYFCNLPKGDDGKPAVVEEEAEVVKLIYRLFLDGKTTSGIRQYLQEAGILTPGGKEKWIISTVMSILTNVKYKGNALLQKTFTVDFLEKKMKVNEGEVPQYYVEGSHEGIIDPDEWDMVQLEVARRKALGKAYSGKSVLSAKLICEDCSAFYGSKVWHSIDKYKKTVWQCNSKFSSGERCQTPTLATETVQQMFITAYNRLMADRADVIDSCKLMRPTAEMFSALDKQIQAQVEETEIVAEMVKALVKENASTAQSQEAFKKKYANLTERYETATAELERLQAEKTFREQQDKSICLFIRTLKAQPEILSEWDNTIWTVMVEKGIVHRDGSITFVFYNGTEIKVGA